MHMKAQVDGNHHKMYGSQCENVIATRFATRVAMDCETYVYLVDGQ